MTDNTVQFYHPSNNWTSVDDLRMEDLSNDPMAMADARNAAEDVMNRVINFLESQGIDIDATAAEIESMTQGLTSFIMEQALQRVTDQGGNDEGNNARARGAEGGGSAGGLSIFERIAFALGTAMVEKANELVELAESVPNASDGDILLQSARVTAAGQELNVLAQTFNSTINSTGQAASTAARKQ